SKIRINFGVRVREWDASEEDFVNGVVNFWDEGIYPPVECALCKAPTRRSVRVESDPLNSERGRVDIEAAQVGDFVKQRKSAADQVSIMNRDIKCSRGFGMAVCAAHDPKA